MVFKIEQSGHMSSKDSDFAQLNKSFFSDKLRKNGNDLAKLTNWDKMFRQNSVMTEDSNMWY